MTYTQLCLAVVGVAIMADLFILKTRLLRRRVFWKSYAIIISFQLLTNGVLTGLRIVRYSGDAIIGSSTPQVGRPPFIGDGRLVFAPVEDLVFGFSLVLFTLMFWVALGRVGIQREPASGPPRDFLRRITR